MAERVLSPISSDANSALVPPPVRVPGNGLRLLCVAVLLLVAVTVRVLDLPGRYQERDVDELPYTVGGLQLLEGLTPGYKYSPAGPLTWTVWAYSGAHAVEYLLHPTAVEKQVPLQVRPFVAVDHALFDQYRDLSRARYLLIIESELASVLAVVAGYFFGERYGGTAGGILLGGMLSIAPFIVVYGGQARPFDEGWSLVVVAAYLAACWRGNVALYGSAVVMGLAIATRIDMFPLVIFLWPDIASLRPTWKAKLGAIVRHGVLVGLTALLVSPWILTNLIGNLRTIFSVRFSPPADGPISWTTALRSFGWTEGLAAAALLLIAGVLYGLVRRQLARPVLGLVALLLLTTVTKDDGHGIGHQGVVAVAMLLTLPMALAAFRLKPGASTIVIALVLLAPAIILARGIHDRRLASQPDSATDWVEAHVPAGSIVYTQSTFNDPLPTPQAADALWQQVMSLDAPALKFGSALTRFHLRVDQIPRALSEENMIVERIDRRKWYILGSPLESADRRFDIRLYGESAVFASKDPIALYRKTGGTLIMRELVPFPDAGVPVMSWPNPHGVSTYLYCSADIKARLTP